MPVDDRVRLAAAFEARAADGRVDGVRGLLLRVEVADVAPLAVRVGSFRLLLRIQAPVSVKSSPGRWGLTAAALTKQGSSLRKHLFAR